MSQDLSRIRAFVQVFDTVASLDPVLVHWRPTALQGVELEAAQDVSL